MAKFKAFKPQALERIAKTMGYTGDMSGFQQYLDSNVSLKERMKQLEDSAMEMSKNGTIKQTQKQSEDTVGAFVPPPTQTFDPVQMQQGGLTNQTFLGIDPSARQSFTGLAGALGKVFGGGKGASNLAGVNLVGAQPTSPPLDIVRSTPRPRPALEPKPLPSNTLPQQFIPQAQYQEGQNIQNLMARQAQAPALPMGATVVPQGTIQELGQMVDPATGQLTGAIQTPIALATTAQTQAPITTQAAQITPTTTQQNVAQLQGQAQQQTTPPVTVQTQTAGGTSVSNLNAAQGTAIEMQNPVQSQIQQGELISPSANAQTAAQFTEQVESATATPSQQATVQGQLAQLTSNFDATNPPSWAAGAIRGVQAIMQQRGLGASSIAGQALIQAAMESALPIASADAQTQAQFEAQNLSTCNACSTTTCSVYRARV